MQLHVCVRHSDVTWFHGGRIFTRDESRESLHNLKLHSIGNT